MLFCGIFGRFFRVIGRMQMVSQCEMGVMSSFFGVAAGVIVSRLLVMVGGLCIVLRRFSMMLYGLLNHRLGRGLPSETR
jgi:hypothetical protein